GDEAPHGMPRQESPSAERLELDEDLDTGHPGPAQLDQPAARRGGPPGREDVVDDEHAGTVRQVLGMDLDPGLPVLERVVDAHRGPGELARLAHRQEAHAQLDGQGGTEDESPGLEPGDDVDAATPPVGVRLHGGDEEVSVREDGGDVLEGHPRLGEVLDIAHRREDAVREGVAHFFLPRPLRGVFFGWLRGPPDRAYLCTFRPVTVSAPSASPVPGPSSTGSRRGAPEAADSPFAGAVTVAAPPEDGGEAAPAPSVVLFPTVAGSRSRRFR